MPLLETAIILNSLLWMAICDWFNKRRIPVVLAISALCTAMIIAILNGRYIELLVFFLFWGYEKALDKIKKGAVGGIDKYAFSIPILAFGVVNGSCAILIGLALVFGVMLVEKNGLYKPQPFIPYLFFGVLTIISAGVGL